MDMRRTREGAHLYREPDVLRITTSNNGTWVTVDVREPWNVILDPEHLETPENEPEWKQRIRDESSTRNWRIPAEAVLMPAELAWGKSLGSSDGREYAWAGARRRKRRKRTENVDSEISNELTVCISPRPSREPSSSCSKSTTRTTLTTTPARPYGPTAQ